MNNKNIPKNVRYAIRMLSFHTRLVTKYSNTIKAYVSKVNVETNKQVSKLEKKEQVNSDNQCTIYDFMEDSSEHRY